ncbi:MAG: ROK family protein [Gammaproteobacteria bacterium]|nr:ROK family protein [Gammaproteobacteria bacterium]
MRIGIDLGGTKTEIIALSDDNQPLLRRRIDTPQGDYQAAITIIADLIHGVEKDLGCKGSIGIATPGAISPASGLIKNANSTCLNGHPFDRDLSSVLEREIRMANDADCFALSEAVDGAGAGESIVFGVIIGTGTGGGVVINQHLLSGPNAIAGEWGHNPLPWPRDDELPGRQCYCGQHGCIETFISGPGMSRHHAEQFHQTLGAAEIVELAEHGDANAETSMRSYEDRMARALASIINVIDPHVIVLGGGLSNIARLYKHVPELWGQYVFSDRVDTRLVQAMHGDSSGVRGAAWLWP